MFAALMMWIVPKVPMSMHSDSQVSIYSTRWGQRASLTLTDGSHVQLGPATTLSVTQHDPRTGVVVTVVGEARFTVRHHGQIPFTVQTERATTHVLGTTFSVREYPTDRSTRVLVTDGRVVVRAVQAVQPVGAQFVLASRMLGVVTDSGRIIVTPDVSVDATDWTTGHLVFDKTRVPDVLADVGRAYGVELRIGDSALATQSVSWDVIPTTQSLATTLDELAILLDARITRNGRIIIFVPGRAHAKVQGHATPSAPRAAHPFIQENQHGR